MYPGSDGWAASAPVGSYPAGRSPFGLDDMAGNSMEWSASRYCPYTHPNCKSRYRVSRGGAWFSSKPSSVRAAKRHASAPGSRLLIGFRCAR